MLKCNNFIIFHSKIFLANYSYLSEYALPTSFSNYRFDASNKCLNSNFYTL